MFIVIDHHTDQTASYGTRAEALAAGPNLAR